MPEIKTKEAVQKRKLKTKPSRQWGDKARRVYQLRKAFRKTRPSVEQGRYEQETADAYATAVTEQIAQEAVHELGRIPRGTASAIRHYHIKNRNSQQFQDPISDDPAGHNVQCSTSQGTAHTPRMKADIQRESEVNKGIVQQTTSQEPTVTENHAPQIRPNSFPKREEGSAAQGASVARELPTVADSPKVTFDSAAETVSLKKETVSPKHNIEIRLRPVGDPTPKQKPDIEPKIRHDTVLPKRKTATDVRSQPMRSIPVAPSTTELGRRKLIQETQKKLAVRVPRGTKVTIDFLKKMMTAVIKPIQAVIGMMAGIIGGTGLVSVFLLIVLIGAILASPLGIFFSNEPYQSSIPLNAAVSQINMDFSDRLDAIQDGDYDDIATTGHPPDWREVVAIYASRTAGAEDGIDVATFDSDRVERLRTVFWDMCSISSSIETIEHPDSDPEDDMDDSRTERKLHITISARSAEEMRTIYGFTEYQSKALDELLSEMATLNYLMGDLSISQEDALVLLQNLPAGLSAERRAVVQHALSLVGKVNYFWGGKSLVLGWDSRWGRIELVWAAGSRTTGTYRPYGLDCSGFVDWVFYNASGGSYVIGHGVGAGSQHRYCNKIDWSEAMQGDLVFYPNDDHVGIVGGRDPSGNLLIIHCASGQNNVVITGISGFVSVARPMYYDE